MLLGQDQIRIAGRGKGLCSPSMRLSMGEGRGGKVAWRERHKTVEQLMVGWFLSTESGCITTASGRRLVGRATRGAVTVYRSCSGSARLSAGSSYLMS
jgi:hypothetical protein